jgi:hypothetical protein
MRSGDGHWLKTLGLPVTNRRREWRRRFAAGETAFHPF